MNFVRIIKFSNGINKIAVFLIKLYKRFCFTNFSPCRYVPSCSCYAQKAFEKYRFFNALSLTIKRIGRCHPFSRGDYDPLK